MALVRQLRKEKFDYLIIGDTSRRSLKFALSVRPKNIVGFSPLHPSFKRKRLLKNVTLVLCGGRTNENRHQVVQLLDLLIPLGIYAPLSKLRLASLVPDELLVTHIKKTMSAKFPQHSKKVPVGIHISELIAGVSLVCWVIYIALGASKAITEISSEAALSACETLMTRITPS